MSEIEEPEPVDISLRELVERVDINLASLSFVPGSSFSFDLAYEITPHDFLSFAEKDILQDDVRGFVNGLSNAKRAIDCQVEKLLAGLGLPSARSFPKKMALLTELGVIAPRIVTKVVRTRNYLEHEYRKPEKEQVEDAVDVATLFVAALERSLDIFLSEFVVGNLAEGRELFSWDDREYYKRLFFEFSSDQHWFKIRGFVDDVDMEQKKRTRIFCGNSVLKASDRGYRELIRLCFSVDKSPTLEDDFRKYLLFVLES